MDSHKQGDKDRVELCEAGVASAHVNGGQAVAASQLEEAHPGQEDEDEGLHRGVEVRESRWEKAELEEEEGEHREMGGGVHQEGEQGFRVRQPGEDGRRGGEGENEKEKVGKLDQFYRTRFCQFLHQDDHHQCSFDCLRQLVLILEQKKQSKAR